MTRFACGDAVPGCEASWVCSDEHEILARVAGHAELVHGITVVDDDLVVAVRARIVSAA